MPRSSAGAHAAVQLHDNPSHTAAAALAKLSASLQPRTSLRLPSFPSVRALGILLALVLTAGLMLPLLDLSRHVFSHSHPPLFEKGFNKQQWRSYTLQQAVEAVAQNRMVIVCTVSQPYLAFLNNWLISLAKQARHQTALVIAEDYATLDFVNELWPGHAVLVPPALPNMPTLRFGSQGFFNFTSRRPRYLLEILELGYTVLYNDVDMVWQADPFPLFVGSHDVYFTDDLAAVKPETHSHSLPPPGKRGRSYICSCMLFMRPTEGAKLLLRTWIKELQDLPWSAHAKSNDQPGFNWALNRTAGQVDVYLLPQVSFPSGGLYFRNETWRTQTSGKHVMVHNNYVTGFEKKMKRFVDFGLWYAGNEAALSPLSVKGG